MNNTKSKIMKEENEISEERFKKLWESLAETPYYENGITQEGSCFEVQKMLQEYASSY